MSTIPVPMLTLTLLLHSIQMEIKFPCKLSLSFCSQQLISQSPPIQNKFLINKQIILQNDGQYFQLEVYLHTDKGAKYIAGVVRIDKEEVIRKEGQNVKVKVGKCLDAQANCQFKIQKVVEKNFKRIQQVASYKVLRENRQNQFYNPNFSPVEMHSYRSMNSARKNIYGTRSQAQFPLSPNNYARQWQQKKSSSRQKALIGVSPKLLNQLRLPPKPRRNINPSIISNNHVQSRSEVIPIQQQNIQYLKQSLSKIKQKYHHVSQQLKQQTKKRHNYQVIQNNYKLEIVRHKLKSQELQRQNLQKDNQIKNFVKQIDIYKQKNEQDKATKQQLAVLKGKMEYIQNNLQQLNQQNQSLKKAINQIQNQYQLKIQELQTEYDRVKSILENNDSEYAKDIRKLKQVLSETQRQLKLKCETLQRQKKLTSQLQKSLHTIQIQQSLLLQSQRTSSKSHVQSLTIQLSNLQQQIQNLSTQTYSLESQKQQLKSKLLKFQYDNRILTQQLDGLRYEMAQVGEIKPQVFRLNNQNRVIKEEIDRKQLIYAKGYQQLQQKLASQIQQLNTQLASIKHKHIQLSQNFNQTHHKLNQTDGLYQSLKVSYDKKTKSLDILSKDYNDLKQKQKTLKNSLNENNQILQDFKDNYQKLSLKYKNLNEDKVLQVQKLSQTISGLQSELQASIIKSNQASQSSTSLCHQICRLKLQSQFAQQTHQKSILFHQQRIKSFQSTLNQQQAQNKNQQQQIKEIKQKYLQIQNKCQGLEREKQALQGKLDGKDREVRRAYQKVQLLGQQIKRKHQQIIQLKQVSFKTQLLNQNITENNHTLSQTLKTLRIDKQKVDQLLDYANIEIAKLRNNYQKTNDQLKLKYTDIQEKLTQIMKLKHQLQQANIQNDQISTEFQQFKQSFKKMMNLANLQAQNMKIQTNKLLTVDIMNISFSKQQQKLKPKTKQSSQSFTQKNKQSNLNFFNEQTPSFKMIKHLQFKYSKSSKVQVKQQGYQQQLSLISISQTISKLIHSFQQTTRQTQWCLHNQVQKSTALRSQIQQLQQQLTQSSQLVQNVKFQLQLQKTQTQDQLIEIKQKHNKQVKERQEKYIIKSKQFQDVEQKLIEAQAQIDEIRFTMESNRMHYQTQLNDFQNKSQQQVFLLQQLEQKIHFQRNLVYEVEQKCYQTDKQMHSINSMLTKQKQLNFQLNQKLSNYEQQNKSLLQQVSLQSQKQTHLNQSLATLQSQFLHLTQSQTKLSQTLKQQQKKHNQLKQFSSLILKEKQNIIKKQLIQQDKMFQLENLITEAQNYKELLLEEIQGIRQELNQQKVLNNKLISINRQSQLLNITLNTKINQLQKLLKQTNNQSRQLQMQLKSQLKTHQSLNASLAKKTDQMRQQLEFTYKLKQQAQGQWQQKVIYLQSELQKQQSVLTQRIRLIQSQLLTISSLESNISTYQKTLSKHQKQQFLHEQKILQFQTTLKQLQKQTKQKQQLLYQMSAQTYQLRDKISKIERERDQMLGDLDQQWLDRVGQMEIDYQARIQRVAKESQFRRMQIYQYTILIERASVQRTALINQTDKLKHSYQQKLKRAQQQRLSIYTSKNTQLTSQSQQLIKLSQKQKCCQSQLRKSHHQQQILHNQLSSLTTKHNQSEQKHRSQLKSFCLEIQQLKLKQSNYKQFYQEVMDNLWNIQREIRRAVAGFIHAVLGVDYQQENANKRQKLQEFNRKLQQQVLIVLKTCQIRQKRYN